MNLNLIIILILNEFLKSEIVLPIFTLPLDNYKNDNSNKTEQELMMNSFYQSQFYTVIQIGQPAQTIPLLIKIEPNLLIITSINSNSNSSNQQSLYTFNFSESFLEKNNFSFYDEKKSNSFILNKCDYGRFYEAEEICDCNETFLFSKNGDIEQSSKIEKFYFNLARNAEDNITGEIGLNLYDKNKRSFNSFLNELKRNKLINKYNWYFDKDSKDNKTKLIIGALPHEIESLKYSENDLMYSKVLTNNYVIYWKIRFTKIFALNSDLFASLKYFDNSEVEFNFDSDVIIGPDEFSEYLFKILDDYIFNHKCFINKIIDNKNRSNKFKFIYCKNDKLIYNDLYDSLLPTIFLSSNEFNYTFEISSEDLLFIKDDYIYLRILFSEKEKKVWKLGKLFSMKYKFIFNPETKQVGFYIKESSPSTKNETIEKMNKILNKEKKGKNANLAYKIVFIIISFIFLCFLVIKYYKIICNFTRQKRKNEIILINDYKYYSKNNFKEMESFNNNAE